MHRALILFALLAAVIVLPAAATEAPPVALQLPQAIECPAVAGPLSPLAPEPEPSAEDLLKAAGLLPTEGIATDTLPACPSVYSCPSGPTTVCTNGSCTTSDTGYTACQSGSTSLSCPTGQTIHVAHCQCVTDIQARCCFRYPFCLCPKCESLTSQSIFCQ